MKVEIEDNLDEIIESLVSDCKERLLEILRDNPDVDSDKWVLNHWEHFGGSHEAVDGHVPCHSKEIKDLYYIHGDKFDEAYRLEGIGDGTETNHQQVAIFCYLRQKMYEEVQPWLEDIVDLVNEKRDEIESEVSELEGQLEDAEDADDEDLVNRLEAEISAFDAEAKLQEFIDELDTDSV